MKQSPSFNKLILSEAISKFLVQSGDSVREAILKWFLSTVFIILWMGSSSAENLPAITRLKPLCLETNLVQEHHSQAVIIAPPRYRKEIERIRGAIRKAADIDLTVADESSLPGEVLKKYHVIAIGNMATNSFIRRLYYQWYTFLDLRYPGAGGYVVNTLHNPYGTGKNVIFAGGSDDNGVEHAVAWLSDQIVQRNGKLGWLMQIELSPAIKLPFISSNTGDWNINSWSDSFRWIDSQTKAGNAPATVFGWNPISIAGVLYYMTGKKEYMDVFKTLALPSARKAPTANIASSAFQDPLDPLVKVNHYRGHLVELVYDLIEESPLLNDGERLTITQKFLEKQIFYDPRSALARPNASRHEMWQMMNIFAGSRYFSRYYPDPVWEKRLKNVDTAFHSFIGNATWGERDTLQFVPSAMEPIFDYFLVTDPEQFVSSRTAKTLSDAIWVLYSGKLREDSNRYLSLGLLHKASYLLHDGRFIWLAHQLKYDLDTFRIGQSYWPMNDLKIVEPTDILNEIVIYPLQPADIQQNCNNRSVIGNSFQIASYKTGLADRDDYFLLDGFNGMGRNPFHLNNINMVRMFNGRNALAGYRNHVSVSYNGTFEKNVTRCAGLAKNICTEKVALVQTEVPEVNSVKLQRVINYIKNKVFIVIDKTTALKNGNFDISISWELGGALKDSRSGRFSRNEASRQVETKNKITLQCAPLTIAKTTERIVEADLSESFAAGQIFANCTLLSYSGVPLQVNTVDPTTFLISGRWHAVLAIAPIHNSSILFEGGYFYLDKDSLMAQDLVNLSLRGQKLISASDPIDLIWDFQQGTARIKASEKTMVEIVTEKGPYSHQCGAGQTDIRNLTMGAEWKNELDKWISKFDVTPRTNESRMISAKSSGRVIQPMWIGKTDEPLQQIRVDSEGVIWATAQKGTVSFLYKTSDQGHVIKSVSIPAEILSFQVAASPLQKKHFAVLAGFRDDTVRAYNSDLVELWRRKTQLHDQFKIGNKYVAPWFTDPGGKFGMRGVYSITVDDVWDHGAPVIAAGRPCTVEFMDLDGGFIARVPTHWGIDSSIVFLQKGGPKKQPIVFVGKRYTGNPTLSAINTQYQSISDAYFGQVLPGYTNMHSWLQRGLYDLRVTDLEGDGNPEVIYTLNGHWNEIRVYDAITLKPLWMHYFGPGIKNQGSIAEIAVGEDAAEKKKIVAVGMKNGSLSAFGFNGAALWQARFESPVRHCIWQVSQKKFVAGLENGQLVVLDRQNGRTLCSGKMAAAISAMTPFGDSVYVGDAEGRIGRFQME